jgi:hypothetical protein
MTTDTDNTILYRKDFIEFYKRVGRMHEFICGGATPRPKNGGNKCNNQCTFYSHLALDCNIGLLMARLRAIAEEAPTKKTPVGNGEVVGLYMFGDKISNNSR